MKRRIKTESGFTLLELLISLAMVAVIVTFCLMAVRLATSSREAGTQQADIHQRLRVLHERLNTTLHSAHLIFVSADSNSLLPDENEEESGSSKILAFEGKPESLKFITFGEKLMGEENSPSMHEVRFYLQKNLETGLLEILLNERNFSPKNFFNQDSLGLETGQTLRMAQGVVHLNFRYYYENPSEKGLSPPHSEKKNIKIQGEWADKFVTKPFDFKSNIVTNRNTEHSIGNTEETVRLPKAVEVSVSLWESMHPKRGAQRKVVELPPIIIPIQTGMVFERFTEEEGKSDVPRQ